MPGKVKRNVGPDVTAPAVAVASVQVETTIAVRTRNSESAPRSKATSKPPSRRQVLRITRLMALAIKFKDMVDRGEVRDYADIARLGYVTRARITQIMNLLLLSPDLQERLLFDPLAVKERHLREVSKIVEWREQRICFTLALGRRTQKTGTARDSHLEKGLANRYCPSGLNPFF